MMRAVSVRRDFVAQHFLIGGDWGRENEWHSHHYRVEVKLEGEQLDQHGYLVDIVDIEAGLDRIVSRYRDKTLNELPEFAARNPSLELFAELFQKGLAEQVAAPNLTAMTVTLWENENAWASYRREY